MDFLSANFFDPRTMTTKIPSIVFLAGSTPELIAALGCLAGLEIGEAAVFFDRSLSFGPVTVEPLLTAARKRFPTVCFIDIAIERLAPEQAAQTKMRNFVQRWNTAQSIRKQLDAACWTNFQMGFETFGTHVQEICFTVLHDYVLVFLAACRAARRVLYPHGSASPYRQHACHDYTYFHRRRSARTMFKTLAQQKKHFGSGGLLLGVIGRLVPGITTVSLPFAGVDRVLTFRSGIDYVPNEVVRVPGLEETFRWLLQLQPWSGLLGERESHDKAGSLLLLLNETNHHPIWEKNVNFGLAHLHLLQRVSQKTGLKRIVIKSHVRSDGSAAKWLADFLKEREREWNIEILPLALSGLPVEALSLTSEFAAACSLGSGSLPPGLGFGMPHYVSLKSSALFDDGWRVSFWIKYVDIDHTLMREGVCYDIDPEISNRLSGNLYAEHR